MACGKRVWAGARIAWRIIDLWVIERYSMPLFCSSAGECGVCGAVLRLMREGRGHCELDAAHTVAEKSTDLEQLEPDRPAGGFG